jgi:hypothetical protein
VRARAPWLDAADVVMRSELVAAVAMHGASAAAMCQYVPIDDPLHPREISRCQFVIWRSPADGRYYLRDLAPKRRTRINGDPAAAADHWAPLTDGDTVQFAAAGAGPDHLQFVFTSGTGGGASDTESETDDEEMAAPAAEDAAPVVVVSRKRPAAGDAEDEPAAKQARTEMRELAEQFECSICCNLIRRCATLDCGHMHCHACVRDWFERDKTCPQCRQFGGDLRHMPSIDGAIESVAKATLTEDELRAFREAVAEASADIRATAERKKAAAPEVAPGTPPGYEGLPTPPGSPNFSPVSPVHDGAFTPPGSPRPFSPVRDAPRSPAFSPVSPVAVDDVEEMPDREKDIQDTMDAVAHLPLNDLGWFVRMIDNGHRLSPENRDKFDRIVDDVDRGRYIFPSRATREAWVRVVDEVRNRGMEAPAPAPAAAAPDREQDILDAMDAVAHLPLKDLGWFTRTIANGHALSPENRDKFDRIVNETGRRYFFPSLAKREAWNRVIDEVKGRGVAAAAPAAPPAAAASDHDKDIACAAAAERDYDDGQWFAGLVAAKHPLSAAERAKFDRIVRDTDPSITPYARVSWDRVVAEVKSRGVAAPAPAPAAPVAAAPDRLADRDTAFNMVDGHRGEPLFRLVVLSGRPVAPRERHDFDFIVADVRRNPGAFERGELEAFERVVREVESRGGGAPVAAPPAAAAPDRAADRALAFRVANDLAPMAPGAVQVFMEAVVDGGKIAPDARPRFDRVVDHVRRNAHAFERDELDAFERVVREVESRGAPVAAPAAAAAAVAVVPRVADPLPAPLVGAPRNPALDRMYAIEAVGVVDRGAFTNMVLSGRALTNAELNALDRIAHDVRSYKARLPPAAGPAFESVVRELLDRNRAEDVRRILGAVNAEHRLELERILADVRARPTITRDQYHAFDRIIREATDRDARAHGDKRLRRITPGELAAMKRAIGAVHRKKVASDDDPAAAAPKPAPAAAILDYDSRVAIAAVAYGVDRDWFAERVASGEPLTAMQRGVFDRIVRKTRSTLDMSYAGRAAFDRVVAKIVGRGVAPAAAAAGGGGAPAAAAPKPAPAAAAAGVSKFWVGKVGGHECLVCISKIFAYDLALRVQQPAGYGARFYHFRCYIDHKAGPVPRLGEVDGVDALSAANRRVVTERLREAAAAAALKPVARPAIAPPAAAAADVLYSIRIEPVRGGPAMCAACHLEVRQLALVRREERVLFAPVTQYHIACYVNNKIQPALPPRIENLVGYARLDVADRGIAQHWFHDALKLAIAPPAAPAAAAAAARPDPAAASDYAYWIRRVRGGFGDGRHSCATCNKQILYNQLVISRRQPGVFRSQEYFHADCFLGDKTRHMPRVAELTGFEALAANDQLLVRRQYLIRENTPAAAPAAPAVPGYTCEQCEKKIDGVVAARQTVAEREAEVCPDCLALIEAERVKPADEVLIESMLEWLEETSGEGDRHAKEWPLDHADMIDAVRQMREEKAWREAKDRYQAMY